MLIYFNSYKEADIVQQEVFKLTAKEQKKHNEYRSKKIKLELDTLKEAQDKQMEALKRKFNLQFSEAKKKRAVQFDEMVQKYRNKLQDFDKVSKQALPRVRDLATDDKGNY